MHKVGRSLLLLGLIGAAGSLGGCTSAILGIGATGAVAFAQERSIGAAFDDKGIQLLINAELLRADEKLFRQVDVESIEGRVVLTGAVPTAEKRLQATEIAWQAPGVKEVNNELQVTDEGDVVDFAKDTWITTQLRTKILTDTEIFDINYTVETVNGVVYLLGIAKTQAELDRVTDHARNINGVVKVVSHVRLKEDPVRRT
jgi:osmotically-inducible protein OsmY